ncbi:hypothetical protein ACGFIG_20610 [Micromonospora sp. NPDC049048]|uniref:hypothetical protein n=1 Tax=Micromonospora sp. NPDC049048 TaxID=3364263 RepID=UPI00371AD6A6
MRENDLDDMFAEFEADAMTSFRPPGVPAVERRVRDRRRRRGRLLAGVGVLLLAGPAGAFAAGRGVDPGPPVPTPAPTMSPPPTDELLDRKVILPDVSGRLTELRFVDARNGWALFDTCDTPDPGAEDCRRTVGRTADGGVTWRPTAPLPDAKGSGRLLPVDERSLTLTVGDGYLVTTDGGAAWSRHPFGSPPPATQAGSATRSGFLVRCPGRDGLGARGMQCPRGELVRIGSGPVRPQPPVPLTGETDHRVIEGGDGRLWLTVRDKGRLTVLVSDDAAATWRKLPTATRAGAGRLLVSPDGADAWLVTVSESEFSVTAATEVWRLVGGRWEQRPGLPDGTSDVAATNGGVLAVTGAYGTVGFWADGRYVDAPAVTAALRIGADGSPSVEVLRDGTVVVTTGSAQIVGVGSGVTRTWTRFS